MGWQEDMLAAAVADQEANHRRDREVTEEFANRLKKVIGRPFAKLDDLEELTPNMDPASVPAGDASVTVGGAT